MQTNPAVEQNKKH